MFRSEPCARVLLLAVGLAGLLATTGCRRDMQDQPRLDPLEASTFFADGRASRPLIEGTVPRGHLREDEHMYTGLVNGELATSLPMPLNRALLERGRGRYDIFCTPCHGPLGDGLGRVVERGLPAPTSFHDPRLRAEPDGYYYDVMTSGFGRMLDYSAQISPHDRWAIVAYVRALQLSQAVPLSELDADERKLLDAQEDRQ